MPKEYKLPGTDDPVELIGGKINHRMLTVLNALFWGLEIKLENLTFRLAETNSGGVLPVFLVGDNQDQVMGASDLTIEAFSDMVAQMPDKKFEELKFKLSSSKALTMFNSKTRSLVCSTAQEVSQ